MGHNYLIVRETDSLHREENILYAGGGSFRDWKEKIGVAPRVDRVYHLNRISLVVQVMPGEPTKKYLSIYTVKVDPIRDGPSVLDKDISEASTRCVEIPLNKEIKKVLCKALEDLV